MADKYTLQSLYGAEFESGDGDSSYDPIGDGSDKEELACGTVKAEDISDDVMGLECIPNQTAGHPLTEAKREAMYDAEENGYGSSTESDSTFEDPQVKNTKGGTVKREPNTNDSSVSKRRCRVATTCGNSVVAARSASFKPPTQSSNNK